MIAQRISSATGPAANERLTAGTAVALLVLLAVECVTIVFLRQLLPVHFFVGALLIPPVALKLGSTGYRFARYYLGSAPYVAKGPPHIVLRTIAPTEVSFIVWVAFTGAHVLGHLLDLPRSVRADLGRDARLPGRSLRLMLVSVALALGTGMGMWALSYTGPWQATF